MSNFVDNILKKLFPPTKKELENVVPYMEESLVRSEQFKQQYFRWLNEKQYRYLLKKIHQSWKFGENNLTADIEVKTVKFTGADGMVIFYDDAIPRQKFEFLFDYLKDKIQNLDYKLYLSDRRVFNKTKRVETIDKHYLKPVGNFIETANDFTLDQQYGNLLLELHWHDDEPQFIKLLSNFYSDRLYTRALPFEQLLNTILD